MIVAAIDAAKRKSGWAVSANGFILHSGWSEVPFAFTGNLDKIVIEVPQIYRADTSKGDPNDLIDCAFVAGRWAGMNARATVVQYHPREWKGQIPKSVHHRRILAVLTPADRVSLVDGPDPDAKNYERSSSPRLDQLDAIGLALFDAGRLFR